MNTIPIFDSLTHPMPNGTWLNYSEYSNNTAVSLLNSMLQSNIQWALTVGMGEQFGGYREADYASYIRSFSDRLYPFAFIDATSLESIATIKPYLKKLVSLGYYGIKVHPRISRISLRHDLLPILIKEANQLGLCVAICTYYWGNSNSDCGNTLEQLHELLCQVPQEKIILLHGGCVRLLELAEIVRHFPKILLDLSFTICKYAGSSVDLDIKYLFSTFDRRLCIGSDSPEISQANLRFHFDKLSCGLDIEKARNIAYRNLCVHIGAAL